MAQEGNILIVDDDADILTAGKLLLKRHFKGVNTCSNPQQIPILLKQQRYDAVLLDMNFSPGESSGTQGYRWLKQIIEIDPELVVVMITAHGGIDVAVEAMKLGATDFISKPWQNEKLVATLSTAVKLGKSRNEASLLRSANETLVQAANTSGNQPIIFQSGKMQQLDSLIQRAAPTDANVLILGENGTGKELVARELHRRSNRHQHVFMSVDLGAVSETLFESELFGHKKGAFTGANEDRVGRLKAADGGTLFLDEIGNLPLHLQAKLLTVLEQRTVTPLGSNRKEQFNVRVIAATNINKTQLNDESVFRQDLLFRLNTVEISIPPLRERPDDIALIAEHYIALYCKKYGKAHKVLSQDAITALKQYSWPGNIRSLRHAIERSIILSEGQQLTAHDFQLDLPAGQAADVVTDHHRSSSVNTDQSGNAFHHEELNLEALEKQAIEKALKTHRYNISHSAKALGLTRAALYRRMEKHGL